MFTVQIGKCRDLNEKVNRKRYEHYKAEGQGQLMPVTHVPETSTKTSTINWHENTACHKFPEKFGTKLHVGCIRNPYPVFLYRFLMPISGKCVVGISPGCQCVTSGF